MKSITRNRLMYAAAIALVLTLLMAAGCGGAEDGGSGSGSASSVDADATDGSAKTPEGTSSGTGTEENDMAGTDSNPKVEITMEDGGKIDLELDAKAAPKTVANFLKLVQGGFYDGLTFHRIIDGFMIQGGDPEGTGAGGSDETIPGEFTSNGWENNISHERGVISMARSQAPDSASSQFFITNADSVFLDGEYAGFGRVTSGMDVVDKISAVETDAGDAPLTPVVIASIKEIK